MTATETVFGPEYAGAYDDLYHDKDYAAECDLVERIFGEHASRRIERVLDLGCGTGGHAVVLAERGYDVVGVDRSESMLRRARERGGTARFEHADITSLELAETFDAVLVMFAVLGYLTSNAEVEAALSTARRHLRPGGLLVADVWYGPAVLAQRPAERVKVIDAPGGGHVLRVASSKLDARRNLCTVEYRLWRIDNRRLTTQTHERHTMRYFFEPELELLLSTGGFEPRRIGGFPDIDTEPSEHTWNVAFVAVAR